VAAAQQPPEGSKPTLDDRLVELMTGYQQGRMEDFNGLYDALSQPLQRYLWTFVRNTTVAEDLLQETFLQIHRARHTYMPPRPVKPWVYAISRHVALMYLRSQRRRKESLPDEDLPEVPVPPEMASFADRATLQRLLAELDHSGKEELVLHHLFGFSFEEVGNIVGCATGTAKVRAHRALNALRERVENHEQGDAT
jgi:RNA polymerase sigma-70 factor (ECF subfamily)